MKLLSGLLLASAANADSETVCGGTTRGECSGKACKWSPNGCEIDPYFQYNVIQSSFDDTMKGMELSSMQQEFDQDKGALQSAGRSASLGDIFGLMSFQSYSAAPMMSIQSNRYFQCPIDVPFCERKACFGQNLESNAYSCYSQPGCCFDEKLYAYRIAFGDNFFKSVPVCYRAIDNSLFNQLASQLGTFQPAFLQPIVDQVAKLMKTPTMKWQAQTHLGCIPEEGSYGAFQFTQQVTQGNMMLQYQFQRVDDFYNKFSSVISQSCGWQDINELECALRGCCWNTSVKSCNNPLGNNLSAERIQEASNFLFINDSSDDNPRMANADTPSDVIRTGSISTGQSTGIPPGIFAGLKGRKKRSMMDLFKQMNQPQMNPYGGAFGGGPFGGGPFGGGAFGGNSFGSGAFGDATVKEAETCNPVEIATNCMWAKDIDHMDFMQKMFLEKECAAKDCCWDSTRYASTIYSQNSNFGNFACPWRVVDYSKYGMPDLTNSLRGCCDYSPCVKRTGRDGSYNPAPTQLAPQPQVPKSPVVNPPLPGSNPRPYPARSATWGEWGQNGPCSKTCGPNGVQRRWRTCVGGDTCLGRNTEETTCYNGECSRPIWGPWNNSYCSRSCGSGTGTITRQCIANCAPGQTSEQKHGQLCNTQACPSYHYQSWGWGK